MEPSKRWGVSTRVKPPYECWVELDLGRERTVNETAINEPWNRTEQFRLEYRGMPDVPEAFRPKLRIVGKRISATAAEIELNRRARSAHLRVAERT